MNSSFERRFGQLSISALICFLLLFLMPAAAFSFLGGKIDSFSADQVLISPDGTVFSTSKIYITPEVSRVDGMPGMGVSRQMPKNNLSIITFMKKNQTFIINHDKKLYCQSSLDEDGLSVDTKDYKDAQAVKIIGKEKVSGYKCSVKEIETTATVYGMTSTSRITVWESDRFDMPLRTKDEEGNITEIRNIDKGEPPAKVFDLPKGYKKVDNMMLAMGMDFGGMGKEAETQAPGASAQRFPAGATDRPDVSAQDLEKALQGLGDKLKDFKFGN